jgi:hypothetical protein
VSVLLDTSFVLALAVDDDKYSERAAALFEEIADGRHGAAFTTDFVVDEALTLAWVRTRRSRVVRDVADLLLAPKPADRPGRLLFVGESAFHDASRRHRRHHAALSFTDCTHLAVMAEHGLTKIATFEKGFEGFAEILA